MLSIGVDIGGTKISCGLVENGKLIKQSVVKTPTTKLESSVVMAIVLAIRDIWSDGVIGIGIGVPGLVDVQKGIVYDVQNIPAFTNVSLKDQLEESFKLPVHVSNDANCFVAGVKHYGVGKTYNNLVGLTLGTGLGGGVILNGKLHEGIGSGAGEFGFIPFRDGIMEHYCSGQFFKNSYDMDGGEVFALAKSGDEKAHKILDEYGGNLGEVIKIVAHTLAPEAVVLGGSISHSFPYFEKSMLKSMEDFPYGNVIDDMVVLPETDPNIALLGAAAVVID